MHKQWLSPLGWRPLPWLTLLLLAALFASLVAAALPPALVRAQAGPTPSSTPTLLPPPATPSPTPGCAELVRNGSFTAALSDWEIVGDPSGVGTAVDRYQSSPYALQLGSLDQVLTGLAGARQLVTIPADSPSVILDVWIFTQSGQQGTGADYQEIALLDSSGGLLFVPYRGPANDNAWIRLQFNVANFAGQTVYLRFAVNNDGAGGGTAMYVDDVRLTACSSGAEPVPAPAATATFTSSPAPLLAEPAYAPPPVPPVLPPPPVNCIELAQNGGFEATLAGWMPGPNPLPAALVTSPVLSGSYAAQLGTRDRNLNSYSSIRQTVSVPFGYARTIVSFWTYTVAEQLAGADRQEFVLLGPGNVVWAVPWKVLENGQAWQQHMYELVGAAGQTFDLYFAAINDGAGGRTALYLDEVHLWGCAGAIPMASSQEMQGAVPPAQAEPPLEAQPVPVPQVYPIETMPSAAIPPAVVAEQSPVPILTSTPALPLPGWTEVAIVTPSIAELATAVGEVARGAAAVAGTALPPEMPPAPLGSPIPATPAISVSVSLTPQPATFLSNITSRLPTGGKLAVIGLVVLLIVLLVIALLRGRSQTAD